jgi:tripartite ATP-independent transporter DctP family solute receptor
MRAKRMILCISVALFFLGGVNLIQPPQAVAAEPYKIKIAHANMPSTIRHRGVLEAVKIIEAKAGNRVKCEVYPSAQLGNNREMLEGTQMGTIEINVTPSAFFGGFYPPITIYDLPFLIDNNDELVKLNKTPLGDMLLKDLDKIRLKGMALWPCGFKFLTNSKRPIRKPEDVKGLKFRVMEAPILIEQFKAIGASAIPIAFPETYNALQTGVVDGQENPAQAILAMKFYEVQKYMTLTNHGTAVDVAIANKKWFEDLPPDLQKIIGDAFNQVIPFVQKGLDGEEIEQIAVFKKYGNLITALTREEIEAFRKATQGVNKKYIEIAAPDGAKFLKVAQEELAKMRRK